MRALIMVATAALALSACSREEAADNTMNIDETMTTNEVLANDTTMDANMDMNATDANIVVDNATIDANTVDVETTNAQ